VFLILAAVIHDWQVQKTHAPLMHLWIDLSAALLKSIDLWYTREQSGVLFVLAVASQEVQVSKAMMMRQVSLFAGLSDLELEDLAGSLGRRTFAKGTIIFSRGSSGRTMYIVESGKVRIFTLSESGKEVTLQIYGPGEVFGEFSLLDGLPRSAGAMALEETVTFTLHRDHFFQHLEASPSMARRSIAQNCGEDLW
jgi:hypothetical protein